ncbi:MAG: hypothetical protein NTU44_15685 [Bacteroidetes bacterium]|nr:hypothetical protein [Bacteroidota bacterium]
MNTIYRVKPLTTITTITLITLITLITSCKKDLPPPLSCDMSHPNQVCREDAYKKGEFIGYIDYKYTADNQLYRKIFHSVNQSYLEQTFEYNSRGLLVYQKNVSGGGEPVEEIFYTYLDYDSLSSITNIRNGNTVKFSAFEYNDGHKLLKKYTLESSLVTSNDYIYDENGELYKEVIKDNSGNITSYKIYHHYEMDVVKIYEYDQDDNIVDIQVIVRNPDGKLREIRYYDTNNALKKMETFTYMGGLLIKHGWMKDGFETEFRLFQYP